MWETFDYKEEFCVNTFEYEAYFGYENQFIKM